MAIYACQIIGLKKEKIYKQLGKIQSVKGIRLCKILPNKTKVFIDFIYT